MDFDETYEVLEGIADASIDGLDLRLGKDKTLRIPSGASHVNPHSRDNTGVSLRHTIEKPTDAALAYVNTLIQLMKQGRDDDGELPPLATLAVFEGMHGTDVPEPAAGLVAAEAADADRRPDRASARLQGLARAPTVSEATKDATRRSVPGRGPGLWPRSATML